MSKAKPNFYNVEQWPGGGWGYRENGGGLTTRYPNRDDAELWAERLNRAYALGRKHAIKEAKKKESHP